MNARQSILALGMLATLSVAPALAHDRGYVPNDPGLSGGITVWGNSQGYSGWSGVLSYGTGYGYRPGYIPWIAPHRHGPQCAHAAGWGYGKAYRKGYRHGSRAARGHGHDHHVAHGRH